jgi:hypothetical protein
MVISAPDGGGFGLSVASAGDVNGDGYADFVAGATDVQSFAGRAYVYLGSATGPASTPATTLTGLDAGGLFGASVASAGDVNGDGYADLVVGASGAQSSTGRAYVYLGSAAGLASTPSTSLTGPDGANGHFGQAVANAGDVNGDGYTDLIVDAPDAQTATGRAYLYLGSAAGLTSTPATVLTGPDGANGQFGRSLSGAGDVNGDGYADLVVGAQWIQSNTGRAYVYLGGMLGLASAPTPSLAGPDGANGWFGASVASAGDVNGDGYADIIVGASSAQSNLGRAYVYLGSAAGTSTSRGASLLGSDPNAGFGGSVALLPPHSPSRSCVPRIVRRRTPSLRS